MTEANFSFTTKVLGDLFTVRGNTPEEFKTNLTAAGGSLIELAAAVGELAAGLKPSAQAIAAAGLGATPIAAQAPLPAASYANAPTAYAPQPQAPADPGIAPTCAHGQMQYRAGTSKTTGNPYKMWACPSNDRNNACKPVWVK